MKLKATLTHGFTTLLLMLATVLSAHAQTNNPRFDWFEYRGEDEVYQNKEAGPDEYQNPVVAGFHPDPSITRVGDDYYLVNSSFSYYPGIPIFHSKDLVNWEQIGHVLDRPSQLQLDSLGISRGVFAPTIRYHEGTYYVISTLVDAGGNFIVTAEDPAGPWSDPVWLPFDGIDPSIFFDDNGKVYITNNGPPPGAPKYDGHRAIYVQEYDPDKQEIVSDQTLLVNGGVDISEEPVWIEAPHLLKVDGTYYLIAAEGGTAENHSEVVFRSDSVLGPYEPWDENPILTQRHLDPDRPNPVTSAGHADFVKTPNGEWWSVFLACRPYQDNFYNTGRETFMLPVRWRDDWPEIVGGNDPLPYVRQRPDLPAQEQPAVPNSGNFTVREDFEGEELKPYWNFIRTPYEQWYDLSSPNGWLRIEARSASLSSLGQPSFIGRRQQHLWATVTTSMSYLPEEQGDKAGLTVFQNRNHNYLMAVTQTSGKPVIRLEKRSAGESEIVASDQLVTGFDGNIELKIEARGAEYNFYYRPGSNKWKLLKEGADGTILSTKKAGGFVGAYIGMYAYGNYRD